MKTPQHAPVTLLALSLLCACPANVEEVGQLPSDTASNGGTGSSDGSRGEVSTADGSEDSGSTSGAFTGCGETTTTVVDDLDDIIPGFELSAAELIESGAGTYQGELSWRPNDGPVMVTYAGQVTPLTMAVVATPSEVRLVEVELDGQFPDGNAGGAMCSNSLEFDTQIEFSTDDGAFAETWAATLVYDNDFGEPRLALYRPIDFAAHQGTLAESDFTFEGASLRNVIVTSNFADGSIAGSIFMEVESDGFIGAGDVASFSVSAE